jgi:hypothetical protein
MLTGSILGILTESFGDIIGETNVYLLLFFRCCRQKVQEE